MNYTKELNELKALDREITALNQCKSFEETVKNTLDQVYSVFECLIDKLEQLEDVLQRVEDTLEGQKDRLDILETKN